MGGAVNRDDIIRMAIIRMAREAGGADITAKGFTSWVGTQSTEFLERFAALVAAHEREACAKVVESRKMGASELMDAVRDMEAAAIRKRGEVKP